MRYRKKPVVIEAMQFDGSDKNIGEITAWIDREVVVTFTEGVPTLTIATLEGDHLARVGDFIIRGVEGEHYPCKPDIFAKTYESVE